MRREGGRQRKAPCHKLAKNKALGSYAHVVSTLDVPSSPWSSAPLGLLCPELLPARTGTYWHAASAEGEGEESLEESEEALGDGQH